MKIIDFIFNWILVTAALALIIGLSVDPAVEAYPEYSQEINWIWTEETTFVEDSVRKKELGTRRVGHPKLRCHNQTMAFTWENFIWKDEVVFKANDEEVIRDIEFAAIARLF